MPLGPDLYSRVVAILKVGLPLTAVAMLAVLFLNSQDRRGGGDLEQAFIAYLKDAAGSPEVAPAEAVAAPAAPLSAHPARLFDPRRLWACARRETMELIRDPIRLCFAIFGPILLRMGTRKLALIL